MDRSSFPGRMLSLAGGLCFACLAVVSSGSPAAGDGCRNPVIAQDFPDPDVLQVGGAYYLYATNPDPNPRG